MDVTESLKMAENSIRDLLNYLLTKKLGDEWYKNCGITNQRITQWEEKRRIETEKFDCCDSRLVYYADFYDLQTIIKKNWNHGISEVFGKLKELEALLDILHDIRNPNAHHRELLPYQKHLAIGISGKIRTQITGYFSKMETGESYYPRIESIQDSLGNTYSIGNSKTFATKRILRPGDQIQFQVSGSDPLGEEIEYTVLPLSVPYEYEWKTEGGFDLTIQNKHVKQLLCIHIAIKSRREFHATADVALGQVDDLVIFCYEVLPPR